MYIHKLDVAVNRWIRINKLLKGDRTSDIELQKIAQRQVKPNSQAGEEGELVDIRLAEDLKHTGQQKRSHDNNHCLS